MQIAVLSRRAPTLIERDHSLAQRAALMCSPGFLAHLVVWREAVSSTPSDSYLAAMRQVIAAEFAAHRLDPEDALAAAVAIAELETPVAEQAAKWLLLDLHTLGNAQAGVLSAALSFQNSSRATFVQARLQLLTLSHSLDTKTRVAALCLLGESYLQPSGRASMPESVPYRFFFAAAGENTASAAAAHYRLGQWYARQAGSDQHQIAAAHFEKGAEHGCSLSMEALAELQYDSDEDFAHELRELADIGEEFTAGRAKRPPAVRLREHWRAARPETFMGSVRGLLRGTFA